MKTLNVGMIGGGFMAKAHSLAYAAMPMFFWPAPAMPVRKGIADLDQESAEDAAQRFGYEKAYGDWHDLVRDPEIDVIDIVTPNYLHPAMAIEAAQAGKHVLCEKPLASTAEEAKSMWEAVKKAGVTNMVTYSYRRTPAVALAKKLINDGRIGKILNFRGTYLQDWSADPNSPLSWRFQRSLAGSGSLGDIGAHVVDFARYLVGDIAAVSGISKTWIAQRPIQQGSLDLLGTAKASENVPLGPVDVDDEILTMIHFVNGAVGSIEATRNAHGRNNYLTFEIHGEQGSIFFNYERRDELQVCLDGNPELKGFTTIYTGPNHPYGNNLWPIPALGIGFGETRIAEIHDFFEGIVSGSMARPTFEDGYQIAEIDEAIIESAKSGKWVSTSL
jgi:predicted dehydrogenase